VIEFETYLIKKLKIIIDDLQVEKYSNIRNETIVIIISKLILKSD
jgi:hypothetical protein